MDYESPHVPAQITLDHECPNCGICFAENCMQPPALPTPPVEYARAVVVSAAGISASYSLYRIVEIGFWMVQHGQMIALDINPIVICVAAAFGSIFGWAFAKKKEDQEHE